jgi:hypothetical protein
MRDLRQIVHDNGGDDTPALDTHNLTGRAGDIVIDLGNLAPLETEADWRAESALEREVREAKEWWDSRI